MKIHIQKHQIEKLKQHAIHSEPKESCALLFGEYKEEIKVQEIFLTKNIKDSQTNFTISNEELIKAYQTAEKKKLDVVGIFHSHPSSKATPSTTDKKFMLSNPVVWVIYSGEEKNFKAYYESKKVHIIID